jgi:hypothetical protein
MCSMAISERSNKIQAKTNFCYGLVEFLHGRGIRLEKLFPETENIHGPRIFIIKAGNPGIKRRL